MDSNEIMKLMKERTNKYKKKDKKMTIKEFNDIRRKVSNNGTGVMQTKGKTAVSAFKGGYHIQKGSYMQNMYGCHTCPFKSNCDKYPHANGGCAERYQYIAGFLKRWQGDSIPLMEELASMNEIIAQNQYLKDTLNDGDPSMLYVALRKLANDFNIHTAKLKHGSTLNIRKEVTYGDIRNAMFNKKPIDAEEVKEDAENKEEIDGKTD